MDLYPGFSLLLRHEHDFVVEQADRGAATTVLAPHGGGIEPHTSDIARLIAGDEYNYFLFNGTKTAGNDTLHITSHRWDHPEALALVTRSLRVITVHGCRARAAVVVVGGRARREEQGRDQAGSTETRGTRRHGGAPRRVTASAGQSCLRR